MSENDQIPIFDFDKQSMEDMIGRVRMVIIAAPDKAARDEMKESFVKFRDFSEEMIKFIDALESSVMAYDNLPKNTVN